MSDSKEKEAKSLGCDLCKTSYNSEKDLKEHLWSLIHHTKIEDQKRNSTHSCTLCLNVCKTIPEYRKHLLNARHKKALEKFNRAAENGKDYVFSDSEREDYADRPNNQYACMDNNPSDRTHPWWSRRTETHTNQPPPYWNIPPWQRPQSQRDFIYSSQNIGPNGRFNEDRSGRTNSYKHSHMTNTHKRYEDDEEKNKNVRGMNSEKKSKHTSSEVDRNTNSRKGGLVNCRNSKEDGSSGEFENPFWHSTSDWQPSMPPPLMMMQPWQNNDAYFNYQNYGETSGYAYNRDFGRYHGNNWNKNYWKNNGNFYRNSGYDYEYNDDDDDDSQENYEKGADDNTEPSSDLYTSFNGQEKLMEPVIDRQYKCTNNKSLTVGSTNRKRHSDGKGYKRPSKLRYNESRNYKNSSLTSISASTKSNKLVTTQKFKQKNVKSPKKKLNKKLNSLAQKKMDVSRKDKSRPKSVSSSKSLSLSSCHTKSTPQNMPISTGKKQESPVETLLNAPSTFESKKKLSSTASLLKDPPSPLISPDTNTISGIDAERHISDTISSPAPIPDCNIKNKYSVKERNPNKPNPNIPIKSLTVKSSSSNKNDSGPRFLKPKSLLKRNSPKVRPVKDSVKISTSLSSDNKNTKSNKSKFEASVVSEALVSSSSSQSHDDDIIIVDPKPQIRPGTSRQNSGEPSTTIDIDAASCSKDHSSDSSKSRTIHDLCSPSRRERMTASEQPADKPQKALAKETLLKLVNSPRSRKERMQLATMLRDHAQSHNRLDSSRIRSDDLDIEQVKHDFNSLCESFGGSRNNLPSIKIEDLTPEIQLQIAQLIEDDSELSVDVQSMLTNTIEDKSNKDDSVVHMDGDDNKTAETKQDDKKTCIQSTVKSEPEWLKKSKKEAPVMDKTHCSSTQPPAVSIDSPSILPESTVTLSTPQSSPEATPSTNKQSMATSSSTMANRPPTTHPNFYPHPYFSGNYPYPPFPPHGFPPFHQPMQFPNQQPNMFNPSFNPMSMPGFNMFPSMGNQYRPMPENMQSAPHTSNHEDQSHRMSPVQASTSDNNDKLLSPHQSSNLLAQKSPVKVETPRKEKIYQTTATSPIKFDLDEPSETQDILAFDDTTPPSAEQRSVMKVLISLSSKEEKIQSHLESVDTTEEQLNQILKKTMQQLNDCREKRKRLLDEQKAIRIKKSKLLTDFIKDSDDVDRDDVIAVNHRVSSCDIGVQISYPLTSSPFVEQPLTLTTTEISHDSVPKTEPMFSPRSLVSYNSHDSDFANSERTSSQSSNINSEVIVESDCSSGDLNMDFIRLSNELGSEDETMATDDQIKREAVEESCSSDVETSSLETVAVVSLQSTCESPFEKIQKMSSPNTSIRFENVHDKIIFSPSKHVPPAITDQPGSLMMSPMGDRSGEIDVFLSPVKKEKCESSPECASKSFRKRSVSESDVDNKSDISPSICGRSVKYLGAITGSPDRASIIKQIAANFAGVTSVSCVRVNQQTTPTKTTAEHRENVEQVNPIMTSCDSVNNYQHCVDSTESSGDLRDCSIILEKLEMESKNSEAKQTENQLIDDKCTSILNPKASTMSPVKKIDSPHKTGPSTSNDNCVVIDSSSESTFDEENIPLASIKQKLQTQQSELSTLSMEFSETDSDEEDMELAKGYEEYFQFLETSESDSKQDENNSHLSTKHPHTKQPFDGPKNSVCGLNIIKNDVFVCYKDYGVRRYSLQSGELMKEYNTEGNIIQCMTIGTTRTGETRLYMAGPALCIMAYEIEESSPMCTIDVLEEVKCLHSDYGHVYGGLSNGMLEVIRLQANKKIDTYQSDDQCIHCITSAREGGFKLLCVSSQDATITVYDAFSGLPVRVLEGHSKTAFSVRVTMNKVYSGSGDKTVMVHDLHTGDLEHVYKDHKGMVTSIYVDGGLLFSASYDRFVRCYDTENQTLKCMYYGAGHSVVSRLVVHDGKLYTGNRDGEISVIHINHQQVWPCQCDNCTHIFGVKDHLLHHVLTDHLTPNSFMTKCTWRGCKQWFSTQRESKNVESHMLNHLQSLDTTTD
ncbi:zinc finger protein 106 isoform X1 [Patella vulgata]|uniref:zinc finger protein 106 isoform X1 n=2 Tax=Patella vulgata TaxID=6465 RepID=UPI00217F3599|nr:zinc finger protein 106 isoform X1 [Patella vulgata]